MDTDLFNYEEKKRIKPVNEERTNERLKLPKALVLVSKSISREVYDVIQTNTKVRERTEECSIPKSGTGALFFVLWFTQTHTHTHQIHVVV